MADDERSTDAPAAAAVAARGDSASVAPVDAAPASAAGAGAGASGGEFRTVLQEWQQIQLELAAKVVLDDAAAGFNMPWSAPVMSLPPLALVGGLDISFVKDTNIAVASLVVLRFPSMQVLHTQFHYCTMDQPYIPGYLAFREVLPLKQLLDAARETVPSLFPQIFFVDGNGVHHPRRCGLASHLGVMCNIAVVGCAKNLLVVDGLTREGVRAAICSRGDAASVRNLMFPMIGVSGQLWGYATMTGNSETHPIFISAGHRISQASAAQLAVMMAVNRVVEPIRQADLQSRAFIKATFGGKK